jgi:signal transduction histidine kinase
VAVLAATVVDDAADAGAEAVYAGPDHLELSVRAAGLRRALTNLVENAVRYGGGAVLTVEGRSGAVLFRVEDEGPGIPAGEIERAVEPFVRLDAARRRDTSGFGLGLATVRRLVEGDGGTFTLANRPNGGLAAEVVLPRRPA